MDGPDLYPQMTVERDVRVPMSDGIALHNTAQRLRSGLHLNTITDAVLAPGHRLRADVFGLQHDRYLPASGGGRR